MIDDCQAFIFLISLRQFISFQSYLRKKKHDIKYIYINTNPSTWPSIA